MSQIDPKNWEDKYDDRKRDKRRKKRKQMKENNKKKRFWVVEYKRFKSLL